MRSLALLTVSLASCVQGDYGVGKAASPNPGFDRPVDLAMDVAFQQNGYGRNVSRCQLQVAFRPLEEEPSTMPGAAGPPPPGGQVAFPEEPGTCAFSEVERPQTGGAEPGGAAEQAEDPQNPEATDDTGEAVDGWQISGAVIGPTLVWMQDDAGRLPLDATSTDQGGVRYELTECDQERFPFSRTLGLSVPESDDPNGIHSFSLDELVAIGPQVLLDSPQRVEGGGIPTHAASSDLSVRWTLDGPDPQIGDVTATANVRIQIQNQHRDRTEADRWVVCWPTEEGWFDVPHDALQTMVSGREDTSVYSTNVDVHTEILGAEQTTPWGRALQVRSHVSAGGTIHLTGD